MSGGRSGYNAYKTLDCEPHGWRSASIRSVLADEFSGEWGSEPKGERGTAKVLRSTNIDDAGHVAVADGAERVIPIGKLARKRLQAGDILLEASGGGPGTPVGRVALFHAQDSREYVCSNFFRTLRPNDDVEPRFLLWRLLQVYAEPTIWSFQQQTTGIINLKVSEYLDQVLRWPPLPEQHRISQVLDTVDEAIQQTEALIAKLKEMKQGLLHDLLTRGLDENGELRDPIAHPEQFKDSPVGRIPSGWEVQKLGDLATMITSGSRGWATYYAEIGALFLRIGNLTREHINLRFDSTVRVLPPSGSEGSRTAVRPGDVLISITADLGIIGVVPELFEEAYVNQHIALVRPDHIEINSWWVGHALASEMGQRQFLLLNDAGAKAGLNLPAVSRLLVPIPVLSEQNRIIEFINVHEARIRAEEFYLGKLHLLKNALLQDLLTGRVRVPAPEQEREPVAVDA